MAVSAQISPVGTLSSLWAGSQIVRAFREISLVTGQIYPKKVGFRILLGLGLVGQSIACEKVFATRYFSVSAAIRLRRLEGTCTCLSMVPYPSPEP